MMKIATVHFQIMPTEEDGVKAEPTTATYNSVTGQWSLNGMLYPKHMKILTMVSDACKEADKGKL